jgi:hypothetical protein
MDQRLREILEGDCGSYILPFFWQHGEPQEVLREEIAAIQASGISEFCVESRVYEKFGQEPWWRDFGFMLDEAKSRGMRVWLLDDKCFPTGSANNFVKEKYPELRKWHLRESHVDVPGPVKHASLLVSAWLDAKAEERIVACVACKRSGVGEELTGECVPLSVGAHDEMLTWDVPDGTWRVFYLIKTRKGGKGFENYIDMINPESVGVLIEAVYESHYAHFSEYFGSTFAGFFSDEPCLGNESGTYSTRLGRPELPLPWRDDMADMLTARTGQDARCLLPALWYGMGEQTSLIRTAYMDLVTSLYKECFNERLGGWCRDHGVMYLGHVIEDMNCHTAMGQAAGHFFRSLDGQDMAGIDVVLHQIVPGHSTMRHAAPLWGSVADPEFFHYSLAKLASSHAHIQPRMKGRAVCEIFGAYGWAEGLPMMKWLTDHMLVRGINHFIPHAFSPKYPDGDCPPHFYARGHNPQYPQFRQLMGYTNRICHLLNGGTHVASAAILYHAEAEWAGGAFMLSQKPAKQLADRHIDYDIVPADALRDGTVHGGSLCINGEVYGCLVLPYAEILPFDALARIGDLAGQGLKVYFVDALPGKSAENRVISTLAGMDRARVVPLEDLGEALTTEGFRDITLKGEAPLVRFYHYQRGATHFYLFFNEDIHHAVDVTVTTGRTEPCVCYDAFENRLEQAECREGTIRLDLGPYQSKLFVFGDVSGAEILHPPRVTEPMALDLGFDIEVRAAVTDEYRTVVRGSSLFDITSPQGIPGFSGTIRYSAAFDLEDAHYHYLDLGLVQETATVRLNGRLLGSRISPPYRFEVTGILRKGSNQLQIEVVNNPAHRERDGFSRFLVIPPSGLLGPVWLC